FAPELGRMLESEWTLAPAVEELFGAHAIKDGQLRMMFSCCHPRLPEEAQVALTLHVLCGFSVDEVAGVFVSSNDAIEKRISRAKKARAGWKGLFDVPTKVASSVGFRPLHRALYLLSNGASPGAFAESAVRADLCKEERRPTSFPLAPPPAATPPS